MRSIAAAAMLFTLSACTSEAERAEKEYDIARKNGIDPADACLAARKAKQAWLEQANESKYKTWSVRAYNACARAEMY